MNHVLLGINIVGLDDQLWLFPPLLEEFLLGDEGPVSIIHPCSQSPASPPAHCGRPGGALQAGLAAAQVLLGRLPGGPGGLPSLVALRVIERVHLQPGEATGHGELVTVSAEIRSDSA